MMPDAIDHRTVQAERRAALAAMSAAMRGVEGVHASVSAGLAILRDTCGVAVAAFREAVPAGPPFDDREVSLVLSSDDGAAGSLDHNAVEAVFDGDTVTAAHALVRTSHDSEARLALIAAAPRSWSDLDVELAGDAVEWLAQAARAERRLQAATLDHHHRTNNTLAMIRAVMRRTAETTDDLDEFLARFTGRVDAIARAQSASYRRSDGTAELGLVLADELEAWLVPEGERCTFDGPPVDLPYRTAGSLALAFHELAANAIIAGALARPDGRLDVSWRVADAAGARALHIRWHEVFGQPATPVEPEEPGLDLVELGLHYEIDAQVAIDRDDTSFTCLIELPLEPAEA